MTFNVKVSLIEYFVYFIKLYHFLLAFDCSDLELSGNFTSGVKTIFIKNKPVEVFCDESGWTVFQSRGQFGNPMTYFERNWAQYEAGFGEPGKIIAILKSKPVGYSIGTFHRQRTLAWTEKYLSPMHIKKLHFKHYNGGC